MARKQQWVPAPIQGISQAPDFAMLDDQAVGLHNFIPQLPDGIVRRPPLEFLTRVQGAPLSTVDMAVSGVSDPLGGRWAMAFAKDPVSGAVVPLPQMLPSGAVSPVIVTPAAQAYLNAAVTVRTDIEARSIGGTTFVWNRKVAVANGALSSPSRPTEGILWVRAGLAARKYTVTITRKDTLASFTATYRTVDNGGADQAVFLGTDIIAASLWLGVSPSGTIGQGSFTGTGIQAGIATLGIAGFINGSQIYLTATGFDFTIAIEDGNGQEGMSAIKGEVDSISNLPKYAIVPGFSVKVIATSTSEDDDYYAKFVQTSGIGTGRWEETLAPSTPLGLSPTTMPIGATYSGGIWTFDTLPWGVRQAGDLNLSPDPDFIGKTIRDMSFFRGRVSLMYGEGVALSSAKDGLLFYPDKVVTTSDDAPIFLTSTLDRTTTFLWFTAFNRRLVVVAEDGLFEVVSLDGALTSASASLQNLNNYRGSARSRPFAVNDRLYFLIDTDTDSSGQVGASIVAELAIDRATQNDAAEPLNTAVPNIIPGGPLLASDYGSEFLAVYLSYGTNSFVMHNFRFAGGQRVQNAFTTHSIPPGLTLLSVLQDRSSFFMHVRDAAGVLHWCQMPMARGSTGLGSFDHVFTDLQFRSTHPQVTRSYDAETDITTIVMPYQPPPASTPLAVTTGPFVLFAEGTPLFSIPSSVSLCQVRGDFTSVPLCVGLPMPESRWALPEPTARDQNGAPDVSASFTITECNLKVTASGYASMRLRNILGVEELGTFSGLELNSAQSAYSTPVQFTGSFPITVGEDSVRLRMEVYTDKHVPLTIAGLTWFGLRQSRSFGA